MARGLGDYPSLLWERTLPDSGNNGFVIRGPLQSPIKRSPCGPPIPPVNHPPGMADNAAVIAAQNLDCLREMAEKSNVIQSMQYDMLAPDYMPKGAIPIQATPASPTSLPAVSQSGISFTSLTTLSTDPSYEGFLTGLIARVYPQTSWADVKFRIVLSGEIIPKFNGRILMPQQFNDIIKYRWYLPPNSSLALQAGNTSSTALLVEGNLFGWQNQQRRY